MTEDDKVKAYMAAHPELVSKIAEEHGVEEVEDEELEAGVSEEEESNAEPNIVRREVNDEA